MLTRPLGIREHLHALLVNSLSQSTHEKSQVVAKKLADIICSKSKTFNFEYVSKEVNDELIAYLDSLMKSKELPDADLISLVENIENFYLSRNYSLDGRYQKQSFFGFTIVKQTSSFNNLLSNLSAIKSKINSAPSLRSIINEITHTITTAVKAFTKNPLLSIFFLSNLRVTIAKAQNTIVKEDGLVAAYLFEGNALDNSGNHHDGVVHGAELITDKWGNPNNAYKFDGNSYILGSSTGFPTDTFTFMAWLLPYAHQIDPSRDRGGSFFGYGGNGAAATSFIATLNPKNIADPNHFYFSQHGNLNVVTVDDEIKPGSLSEWVHLAVTNGEESGFRVYINGEFKEQVSVFMKNIFVQDKNFVIGSLPNIYGVGPYADGNVVNWDGGIDNIYIFNTVKSPTEVQKNYLDVPKVEQSNGRGSTWPYIVTIVGAGVVICFGGIYACFKIKRQKNEISTLEKKSDVLRTALVKADPQKASEIISNEQSEQELQSTSSIFSKFSSLVGLRTYERLSSGDPDEEKPVSNPSNSDDQVLDPRDGDIEVPTIPSRPSGSVVLSIDSENVPTQEVDSESGNLSRVLERSSEIPQEEKDRLEQKHSLTTNLLASQTRHPASQPTIRLSSENEVSSHRGSRM